MKARVFVAGALAVVGIGLLIGIGCGSHPGIPPGSAAVETALPAPRLVGDVSVEAALARRRSVRSFAGADLTPEQIGQLSWAAQGITEPSRGLRTAPSAGALYPLRLYLVTREGAFRYLPEGHKLLRLSRGDLRGALSKAALGQRSVLDASVDFVITGVYARTAVKYGARAERYVHLEAGHAAQNIHLQAVALGLGSVPVGAFEDGAVTAALDLPADETPLYIIPVGHPTGG